MAARTLILIAIIALASPSRLQAAERVSSCAWIRAENDGSGAGFVVDARKRWLITCRHVVADRDKVDVFFPWIRDGEPVTDKTDYLSNRQQLRDSGLLVSGKVLKKSDAADLALIELESLPPGLTGIPLAANAVQSGDSLRVVGHRLDLDTVFNTTLGPARQTGRLTAGYNWRGKKLAQNADVIIGQLPIEEGDSGGPVLNSRGELVGMASALRRQTPTAAVAISVAEIRKFLTLDEPKSKPEAPGIGDKLIRATVWIRPMATDVHLAGVLFEKNLILTSARGLGPTDRVGIAFPLHENGKFSGDREPYRDPLGLHLKGAWRAGFVIARDVNRDLAVIRIESAPSYMRPISLAEKLPEAGGVVHSMSHPGGLEFAWVYASGSLRQRGHVALADGEKPAKVAVNVLQLPAQSGSPGGPVVNANGELIGVLSGRESAQQTGYAATTDEIAAFLDVALITRPAKSVAGLRARAEAIVDFAGRVLALAMCAGWDTDNLSPSAESWLRLAVALDPDTRYTRFSLVMLLRKASREDASREDDYLVEVERMAERPRCDSATVFWRALDRKQRGKWRPALADFERILEVSPDDIYSRRPLVRVLLELNKDEEAAAAAGDLIRADQSEWRPLALELIEQADALAKKFPATPSVPANWLKRAISAAHKSTTDPNRKAEIEVVLKAAADAADDAARLAILRTYLDKLTK